ncbi:MAG: FAD:protein FMN transferase [Rhodospirillaceae bacterium]
MQIWYFSLFLPLIAACSTQIDSYVAAQDETWVMGTTLDVIVYRPKAEEGQTQGDLEAALSSVKSIDRSMSLYRDDSELVALNSKAGTHNIALSRPMANILSASVFFANLSNGAFDVTIQPIVDLWGFYEVEEAAVPPQEEITRILNTVGMEHFALDLTARIVSLESETQIDLGAIAKGYAVDQAIEVLQARGVSAALVNLGGTIRVFGNSKMNREWIVGVKHPRKNRLLGEVRLVNGAISTSGDYDRFFEVDGERYSHIIDPRSGYPSEGMTGLTVIASTATAADALSTAAFVLGPRDGMELLARCDAIEGLLVEHASRNETGQLGSALRVLATGGIQKHERLVFDSYSNTTISGYSNNGKNSGPPNLDCEWGYGLE